MDRVPRWVKWWTSVSFALAVVFVIAGVGYQLRDGVPHGRDPWAWLFLVCFISGTLAVIYGGVLKERAASEQDPPG